MAANTRALPADRSVAHAQPCHEPSCPEPKAAVALASEQILEHLNARGFVPFHPTLAQHLGHKAALFLGLCLYWTRHGARNNPQRQGWFYLSSAQIAAATSLSRREQETVREVLAAAGLLEQQLAGRPAKMHYRLSLRGLANRLEIIDAATATPETVWAWFERSVSFYRPLGDLAGSAAGGLFLSFVLRQQRQAVLAGRSADVLRIEPAEVERTLCLSPKTQRSVRQRLMRLGVLTIPPDAASMVQVNVPAILACLRGQDVKTLPTPGPSCDDPGAPTCAATRLVDAAGLAQIASDLITQRSLFADAASSDDAASSPLSRIELLRTAMFEVRRRGPQVAGFQQLRRGAPRSTIPVEPEAAPGSFARGAHAQTANLGSAAGAQTAKLEPSLGAQSAKLGVPKPPSYIQTGSTNTTTTNPCLNAGGLDQEACRRRLDELSSSGTDNEPPAELIFPEPLPSGAVEGLRSALNQVPASQRQQLLDELQGQLRMPGKTIHNPVGWMLGLIRRWRDGAVLALSAQVAQDRQRRLAMRARSNSISTPDQSQSSDAQGKQVALQRLQALRQEFSRKVGRP